MCHSKLMPLVALTCLLSLSGCGFLGKIGLSHSGSKSAKQAEAAPRLAQSATDEGRDHLRANRPGKAIESFNLALFNGEDPAAAYNGLGVSYARLGRNDLAYRFFKKANASDPENPVYAGNLVRLVDSPSFALSQMDRAPAAAPPRAVERPVVAAADTPAPRVRGKLYREGRGQFALNTQPLPETATLAPRGAAQASCTTRTKAGKVQRCAGPALPRIEKRPVPTSAALAPAVAAPAPGSPDLTVTAEPGTGKRKVIEFAPAASKPAPTKPMPKNAAL